MFGIIATWGDALAVQWPSWYNPSMKAQEFRQSVRLELLAVLSQLSPMRPEWRLGQTLANLATTAGRLDPGGVWDLEDEEALAAARTLVKLSSIPSTRKIRTSSPVTR